jgi:hypothetical protein
LHQQLSTEQYPNKALHETSNFSPYTGMWVKNGQLRKIIRGKLKNIRDHLEKIEYELEKDVPDQGLIAKWQRDIQGFEREIAKYSKRLPGRRDK